MRFGILPSSSASRTACNIRKEKRCHGAWYAISVEIDRCDQVRRSVIPFQALGFAIGSASSVEAAGEWTPTYFEPIPHSMSELIDSGARVVDTISGLSGIGFLLKMTNDEPAKLILCEFRQSGGSKPSAETRCFALNK